MDPQFVEREYNNRARVPEHADYFARWERDSAFVRRTIPARLDLAYGPDARHRIDLFPARDARGTLLFVHGGYWRSLDKGMFSWLASTWTAAGLDVAMPNYRFCPAVRIDAIVEDAIAATNWLLANGAAHGLRTDRVALAGHSAGAHLVAAVVAAPRAALRFDPARILGAIPVSGIYDFEPLRHFSFNADFCLDEESVRRLDLSRRRPTIPAPLVIAAGAAESSEFVRQSRLLAEAWKPQVAALHILPGIDHFNIVDTLAERGQPLHEAIVSLFQ